MKMASLYTSFHWMHGIGNVLEATPWRPTSKTASADAPNVIIPREVPQTIFSRKERTVWSRQERWSGIDLDEAVASRKSALSHSWRHF